METDAILQAFGITAPCTACIPLANGHVHRTFRLETTAGSFILQELRHPDPAALMAHVTAVTAWMQSRSTIRIPHYYAASEGYLYAGRFRLMDCIPGAPLTAEADPAQIEAAGFAFGRFDAALHGISGLHSAYPGLHDTRACLEKLRKLCLPAACTSLQRRAVTIGEAACSLCDKRRSGLLRPRIVHGDTKGSNVLLQGKEPAVIDLDTVGEGLAAYDYGDGIRSLAQKDGTLDRERFRAFTRGFLRGMPLLDEAEIASLVPGIYCISAELAMRYLTDLAEDCRYFRKTPEQAAARARELLSFAMEILTHETTLQGEIQSIRSIE